MKRWAVLTVLLYALALLLLTTPVMLTAFGNWGFYDHGLTLKNASHVYRHLGYWLWLAVLIAGQASLLLVPINIAERRLPARRPLEVPILVTGFFLANLLFAGLLAVFCAAFKEEGFGIFSVLTLFKANEVAPSNLNTLVGMIVTIFVFWFIWAMIFQKSAKSDNPDALLKRSTRWLLRGSILELLVAVPSHIIVRRRDDCCAPAGTFWGIATGISVMLLCFGPGVFFLFVERFERLKPKPPSDDKASAPSGAKSL
jgi:hypothetical protein